MPIDQNGSRPRYRHERVKVESQQGNPLRQEISLETRRRLLRELRGRISKEQWEHFVEEVDRVLVTRVGRYFFEVEKSIEDIDVDRFSTVLEIGINILYLRFRYGYQRELEEVLGVLQSILADDLSYYRIVHVGPAGQPEYQIHDIDNKHLHTEIVDRTFELTTLADFAVAQRDYAEAWKHYSRGDLDDALVNAAKAVESACKVIINRAAPGRDGIANKQLKELIPILLELEILPSRLGNVATHLRNLLQHSGSLRNDAGVAHGSLELSSPEASVALLGLRLAGSLVSFLCARHQQMTA